MYVSVCVVRRVRVVDPPAKSIACQSSRRAAGRSRARGGGHGGTAGQRHAADDSDSEHEPSFQSYNDPYDGQNPVPPFVPSETLGFQLAGHYTRGSLATTYSFFKLFFTDSIIVQLITQIVAHKKRS